MNEMGGARGTYLEEERRIHGFGEEPDPRGRLRHFWEGGIILKWIEYRIWGVDGIALVQDGEKWWIVVNAAINLRVSQE